MTRAVYEIVEHDGGWAYRVGDVYSGTYGTYEEAYAAAERAASEQEVPGNAESIEYQDEKGVWHREREPGESRPETEVSDGPDSKSGN